MAQDQFLSIFFLFGETRSKYSQLVLDLKNSYIFGVGQYPTDVEEAYSMVLRKYLSTVGSM